MKTSLCTVYLFPVHSLEQFIFHVIIYNNLTFPTFIVKKKNSTTFASFGLVYYSYSILNVSYKMVL